MIDYFTKILRYRFITVFILFFSISSFVLSQDRSIKVYANQLIFSRPSPEYFDSERNIYSFHGMSLAYEKSKNEINRQIELAAHFRHSNEPNESFSTNYLHLRYEKGKRVERFSGDHFEFSFGKTFRFHYQSESIDARSFSDFERENLDMGLSVSLFAAGQYSLTKKVSLDFRLSSIGVTLGHNSLHVENPNVREDLRQTSSFYFDLLRELLLRIGIAYKF